MVSTATLKHQHLAAARLGDLRLSLGIWLG